MNVRVVSGDITGIKADAIIVNLFEGVTTPAGATGAVDKALGGLITRLIADGEIKGKLSEMTLIHTVNKLASPRVIVAGIGKEGELSPLKIRGVAAEACRFARKASAGRVATIAHGAGTGGIDTETSAQAVTEGSILGLYTFRKHKTKKDDEKEVEEVLIIERDKSVVARLKRGLARGKVLAEATNLARDMSNEPANHMTPTHMAAVARKVADDFGLECEVLEQEQMRELGMGALLGVAQGSRQPPKFIVLRYKGGDSSQAPLGLIGKGITFDSGGISIKPSEAMGDMKGDMSGGGAVIAAMRAIAELKPRLNVTGLVPATENLPDGAAVKPGDILMAMNGKTIEIVNTDAEGRLVLADALGYAHKLGLSPLVDIATLTGACHVALGDVRSGAFTNNQELLDKVMRASDDAGERFWQLPMDDDYKEQNKSDVADIKNTGGRWGGAVTAAQFLAEFAGDTPWVHLDIAGTDRSDKDKGLLVKGATGVGARTLANLALSLARHKKK
ncbi:MAG: leucyl aminopeptidase [Chloroflexota bacterium]|nr:leucyl aminopeptidase [Chloroflexota bacterium]